MAFQTHLNDDTNEREKSYRDFSLDRPGKIIFVGHHLSTGTQVRCLIRTINLAGAVLEVSRMVEVPNHFFLEILGIRDEIGSTVVKREGDLVTISFNMLINAEFLHHVLRLSFEADV
ncbi:hypothetical protein AM571_CH01244 [Rhizobium etli 8C-3]|uniref:PilZ domain-containing protein n=2 Tax=Rhizobium TaxID=379 RepID=A0A4R3QLL8_9HYPH|nr:MULTISPECIES: hypothetical protein [Rhizobium]APO74081.1 hypothetical protein AM571_CH01244 [Rhizobium etli 8C-3]TCU22888.1 hypothetical protein EV130_10829 [Rhizobium azibense]TCU36465.1 hypothetical protein EV129_10729 [Rhizobium azibense]